MWIMECLYLFLYLYLHLGKKTEQMICRGSAKGGEQKPPEVKENQVPGQLIIVIITIHAAINAIHLVTRHWI